MIKCDYCGNDFEIGHLIPHDEISYGETFRILAECGLCCEMYDVEMKITRRHSEKDITLVGCYDCGQGHECEKS